MRNFCLATLRDAFPVSLIQWKMSEPQKQQAKEWFAKFFDAGLVEPVLKMGGQWYRRRSELRTVCCNRLAQEGLEGHKFSNTRIFFTPNRKHEDL